MRWLLLSVLLVGCPEPEFRTTDAGPNDAEITDMITLDALVTDADPLADAGTALDADVGEDAGQLEDAALLEDATPDAALQAALVGRWLSEGADLAPLLSGPPANLRRLEATFRADGTFVVAVRNQQAQAFSLEGTYTLDEGTDPAQITLRQTRPEPAVSEGIWVVEGDTLRYEVAQIDPPIAGVLPPSVAGGFGSTSNGDFGADNVQRYQRQP